MTPGEKNIIPLRRKSCGNKTADVTSYDYDAPLTEDGQITEKYRLFKETISKYKKISEIPLTTKISRKAYGEISCSGKADLFSVFENIAEPIHSVYPLTMEEIGQNYGYILYRLKIMDTEKVNEIRLEDASDMILCYHDGEYLYTAFAETIHEKFEPEEKKTGGTIHLLCENMGRENFGMGIENQRKGISGGVKINDHRHFGYDIFPRDIRTLSLHFINLNLTRRSLAIPFSTLPVSEKAALS